MSPAQALAAKLKKRPAGPPPGRPLVWCCKLRECRKKLGLSTQDVSKATGVSVAVVNAVERGTDPMLTTALKLTRFFGWSIEAMWPTLANGRDIVESSKLIGEVVA